MTLLEAIAARHSVRKYKDLPLPQDVVENIQQKTETVNAESGLHIQLVTNEPKGFKGLLCYGTFKGVKNYLVIAGKKGQDLDEKVGYYGEQLVLLAQQLGLNTCWAALTYQKVKGAFTLNDDEKVICFIALGYGETQGSMRKHKRVEELSNATEDSPTWFRQGMEAARLAPTAINQQKFHIEYIDEVNGKPRVKAERLFSFFGYTKMDLGIVKLHFEIGAGKENFEWIS
ncbi:MAG: nitroreductase [Paludibacteraceae bacterium]|nr:nitroreductase [Paludibacteraceae bacterium]